MPPAPPPPARGARGQSASQPESHAGQPGAAQRAAVAERLGVSLAAVELLHGSELVDLHVDTFIWQRLFGYDLTRRHGTGPLDARFLGQADLPRCLEAGLSGACWIITTNPLRTARGKCDALLANLAQLKLSLGLTDSARVVSSASAYRAARSAGRHAALIGVQGGNALEHDLADFDRPELRDLTLVTLLHFTPSRIGAPALPRALRLGNQRLTAFGADYVRKLNQRRILVDLAHISREGFWDALSVHDRSQPLTVSHAACDAVYPHFRNIDDDQLRAVADTGGVVGIIFQSIFLHGSRRHTSVEHVVDHVLHALRVIGDDHLAIGSDFDGAIITPRDLKTVLELPRLVDALLRRGVNERSIQKLLGENFLRVLTALRP
ncbi:MAG TPA: membrane dipeptidase [Polyangiales bacterium]